ncbi:uncharacterized protein DS421_6g188150 [Arachis hypogaea]|nr:uncharacterized protein DS421_6g188150 [Arachis hypogaea]
MSNNMWSLLLPEGFQIENLKLGNISKFQIPTLIPFLFRISSYSFLTFSQPLLHVTKYFSRAGILLSLL